MAVTIAQLRAELQEWHDQYDRTWGNVWDDLEDALHGNITLPSGKLKFVAQEGGEGEGEKYFYVFSIGEDDDEQLFRVDGYYASWDGVTYDDYGDIIKEVEAVIVPSIQYQRKK